MTTISAPATTAKSQIQVEITQIDSNCRPSIRTQQPSAWCQIVAVFSQETDLIGLQVAASFVGRSSLPVLAQSLLHAFGSRAPNPPDQPCADVPTTGHRGNVVNLAQVFSFCQYLQDAKVESGAANASAGEGQAHEVVCTFQLMS